MATEDEEFDEGVFDNDEDDVGAIERSADPRRIELVELAAFAVEFTVNEDYTSDGMNNGWVKVNGQKRQEITLSAPDCYANSPFQLHGNA